MNKELADRVLSSVESWAQFAYDNPDDTAEAIYLLHALASGDQVDWSYYDPCELKRVLGSDLVRDLVKAGYIAR